MSARRRRVAAKALPVRGSARLFAALGDETRLHIVARLSAGESLSIARLTAGTGVTRQAVTKHLRVLSGAGLVRDRRVGRERVWDLKRAQLEAARRSLERISAEWDEALGQLQKLVER
jgi:DNA-binding transcriptional ArsR family regulator